MPPKAFQGDQAAEVRSGFGKVSGAGRPAKGAPTSLLGLMEKSGIIYFRWDFSRGTIIDVGESVADVLGYTRDQILADPAIAARITHPEFGPKLQKMVGSWTEQKPAQFRFEGQYVARDGREVWLEVVGVPEYSPSGELVGAQALAMDISQVVQTRRLAEDGWGRYRAIFEDAPIPMVLYDPETFLVIEANQQACQLYGTPREEFEGTFLEEYIAPEEWTRLEERLRQAIADPRVHIVSRMVHRRTDGSTFPAQVASVNINQQGKSRRLAVVRDLTDAELADASLRSLRVAAETGGRALFILDRSRRIAFSNPAAGQLTGYSAEELHGQDPRLVVADGFEEALWTGLEQAEAGHPWKGRLALEPPGGGTRLADADVLPVTTLAGAVTHFVVVLREAQPNNPLQPRPPPAPEPKEFFVGLLAQPLTQSLAAIESSLEQVAASPGLPEELAPDVRFAFRQATAALHMMREFEWVLGRHTEAGAPARGAVAQVVEDAMARTASILGDRDLDAKFDERTEEAQVRTPVLVGEALLRLFAGATGTDASNPVVVEVSAVVLSRNGEPHVRVRIAGRGGPLNDDERARLFAYPGAVKDVQRPSSSPSLALARLLLELMGGAVHAESRVPGEPTQGTAFVVTLPCN